MGKYRILGTFLDRIFRNDLNANFNDIDADIKTETSRATKRENDIDQRVNDLIAGTEQPSEVVDARRGLDGTNHEVLKQRLDKMEAPLIDQTSQEVTLGHGISIIETDQASALNVRIKGRTLVNLLGKEGNFEGVSWTNVGANLTKTFDTTYFVYGSQSQKIVRNTNGFVGIQKDIKPLVKQGAYYLVIAEMRVDDDTLTLGIAQNPNGYGNLLTNKNVNVNNKFQSTAIKFQYTGQTDFILTISSVTGGSTGIFYIDGVRLYEVPADIYNKIDVEPEYTGDKLAEKFPYLDSVKHIQNPVVKSAGKNLLPPFNEWTLHANAKVISPYELELSTTAAFEISQVIINAIPNQMYTLQSDINDIQNAYVEIYSLNSNAQQTSLGRSIGTDKFTVTTLTDCVQIKILITNKIVGTFSFSEPMLVLGDSSELPESFEPANPSYLYAQTKLASNLDGTVKDELYQRDGQWYRLNKFKKDVVLDGSLSWSLASDYTGYKRVYTSSIQPDVHGINDTAIALKYDGKIIKTINGLTNPTSSDQLKFYSPYSVYLNITVADTDSGWGENYNPTVDDIKAYFNGWKMCNSDGTVPYSFGNPYWKRITDGTGLTNVRPTTSYTGWTPYLLTYQIATPVEEQVTVEGALNLIDGGNQIEVSEGTIVREVANVQTSSPNAYINLSGEYQLKNKLLKFIIIYKNGVDDTKNWIIGESSSAFGKERAYIDLSKLDPTAEYTVTYIALDKFDLTANTTEVITSYDTNMKMVVDDLVTISANHGTQISINKNAIVDIYARIKAGGL